MWAITSGFLQDHAPSGGWLRAIGQEWLGWGLQSPITGTCMRSGWKLTGQTAWFKSAYPEAEVQTGLARLILATPKLKRVPGPRRAFTDDPSHTTWAGRWDHRFYGWWKHEATNGNDQRARSTRRFKNAVKTALSVPH